MGWRDSLGEWGFNKWNVRKFLDQNLLCFWKISENPLLALKGQLVDFFFPLLSPYCISAAPRQASNKSKWLFLRQKHLCDLWEHSNPNNQAGSQVAQTTGKQSQYLRGLSSASEAKLSRILFFFHEKIKDKPPYADQQVQSIFLLKLRHIIRKIIWFFFYLPKCTPLQMHPMKAMVLPQEIWEQSLPFISIITHLCLTFKNLSAKQIYEHAF